MNKACIASRIVLVMLVALIAFAVWPTFSAQSASPERSPAQISLQAALDNALAAGSYHFIADVEQMLLPRRLPHMIGAQSERLDMRITGHSDSAENQQLAISFEGSGSPIPAIATTKNGDDIYIGQDGDLNPVDAPKVAGTVTILAFDHDGRNAANALARSSDQPIPASVSKASGSGEL